MRIKVFYNETEVNKFILQEHIEVIKIDFSYFRGEGFRGYAVMVVYKKRTKKNT